MRELERRIVDATRRWEDELQALLLEREGEERGNLLFGRYGLAFPAGYREDHPARSALVDLETIDALGAPPALAMNLYRPFAAEPGTLRFRLFRAGAPVALSDALPILENLGVRVIDDRPYHVQPADGRTVWVVDFGLALAGESEVALDRVRPLFHEAFEAMWSGRVEPDDLNRLVLAAELSAREIAILRAYTRYLRQAGIPFSLAYMQQALVTHAALARRLVALFEARFDPARASPEAEQALTREIEAGLEQVPSLDDDRILRRMLETVAATTRSNAFQRGRDGANKPYISLKFDPRKVPELPEPRPMFEIFVYAPRVEGVHLRGGPVARGGLRWSDRREDFRTEVLGLMKAQMVKNAVIVPVGSKGGFVVKQPPPGGEREALLKEGIECYQTFLRGLLDLTDNLVDGKPVPPPDVVRHDGDDPYLVVAADKGTASFSDIANGVAAEYGFWLGDAFASGGSAGYDHKKMGITARGAWESVKRHFRELGIDTQSQPFSVAGIGDMSGDVFGNGMLLSRHIRLVAAFDHRHIYIDPDPDPAASFRERERLFALPRSSWADYDPKLISKGGGVWPRSAKSIRLSAEARRALGIEAASLAPNELVSAILKAPVDLLYNGGIGTYVKSRRESHAQVGDRANDALRVDGAELRCKVIAEGGNLGLTQLGRIEYALAGGRVNTDAIDNSAGVDCSDHEVNIKILLDAAVREGELTLKQRNSLLAEMTDEVAALVLRDNTFQTQSLSVAGLVAPQLLDQQARFIHALETSGRLKRADRVPSLGGRARRAQVEAHRPGGARARSAAGLLEDGALRGTAGLRRSGGADHRRGAGALFSPALARALRAPYPGASAAARNHRHLCHQQHAQPRRQHLRASHARGNRRGQPGGGARLHGGARGLWHGGVLAGQRSARRQGARPQAGRHAARVGAPARARHALAAAKSQAPGRRRAGDRAFPSRRRGARRAAAGRALRARARSLGEDPRRLRRGGGAGGARGAGGGLRRAGRGPRPGRGRRGARAHGRGRGGRLFRARREARVPVAARARGGPRRREPLAGAGQGGAAR